MKPRDESAERNPGPRGRGQRRILIAASAGIAAYKVPELAREFVRAGDRVRCILTSDATRFVSPTVLEALTGAPVATDLFASGDARQEGEGPASEIGHIALADWAEIVIVAPATANLLARMAG